MSRKTTSSEYPEHLNPFAERRRNSISSSFRDLKKTFLNTLRRKKRDKDTIYRPSSPPTLRKHSNLPVQKTTIHRQTVPANSTSQSEPQPLWPRSRFSERLAQTDALHRLNGRKNPFEEEEELSKPSSPRENHQNDVILSRHTKSLSVEVLASSTPRNSPPKPAPRIQQNEDVSKEEGFSGTIERRSHRRKKKRAPLPPGHQKDSNLLTVPSDQSNSQWSLTSDYSEYSSYNSEYGEDIPPSAISLELSEDLLNITREIQKLNDDSNNNLIVDSDGNNLETKEQTETKDGADNSTTKKSPETTVKLNNLTQEEDMRKNLDQGDEKEVSEEKIIEASAQDQCKSGNNLNSEEMKEVKSGDIKEVISTEVKEVMSTEVKEEITKEIKEEISKEFKEEIEKEIKEEIKNEIEMEMKKEIEIEIKKEIEMEIKEEIKYEIKDVIKEEIKELVTEEIEKSCTESLEKNTVTNCDNLKVNSGLICNNNDNLNVKPKENVNVNSKENLTVNSKETSLEKLQENSKETSSENCKEIEEKSKENYNSTPLSSQTSNYITTKNSINNNTITVTDNKLLYIDETEVEDTEVELRNKNCDVQEDLNKNSRMSIQNKIKYFEQSSQENSSEEIPIPKVRTKKHTRNTLLGSEENIA